MFLLRTVYLNCLDNKEIWFSSRSSAAHHNDHASRIIIIGVLLLSLCAYYFVVILTQSEKTAHREKSLFKYDYDEWVVMGLNNLQHDMHVYWEEEHKDIPQRFPSFSKTDWNDEIVWLFEVQHFNKVCHLKSRL